MTPEIKLTAMALSTLAYTPGDQVQMISVDDDDPPWLLGATGVVESVTLSTDPDDWQCTVRFDLRGKRVLVGEDIIEELLYEFLIDLLMDPPEELPDELPIYETEVVSTVYASQLKSARYTYAEGSQEDIVSV